MKTTLLFFFSLFISICGYSQNKADKELEFNDFNLDKIDKSQYYIVEISGDKKSAHYINVKNDVLMDIKVQDILTSKFQLFNLSDKSKKKFPYLKNINIAKTPSYLFFNPQGELCYKIAGNINRNEFLRACEISMNIEDNYHLWKQDADDHSADAETYFKIAKCELEFGGDYDYLAQKYFKLAGADFMRAPHGMEAILLFTQEMTDPRFRLFIDSYSGMDHAGMDEMFIQRRIYEIIGNSLLNSLYNNEKINLEDTIKSTNDYFMLDDPDLLRSMVTYKFYEAKDEINDEYWKALIEYTTSAQRFMSDEETYNNIEKLVLKCKNPEILMLTNNQLHEVISLRNKIGYQKLLMDLSLKLNDYNEARFALNNLVEMNLSSKMYSQEDLDKFRARIDAEQMEFKEAELRNRKK